MLFYTASDENGDAILSGPEDPGLGTRGPGPKLAYIVCVHTYYIHSTYIVHNYIVHVSLIARLECTMERTKKFCV